MTLQSRAPFLRLGTRGSPLALAQAHEVQARLAALHGVDAEAIEIVVISTSGDRIQDRPLSEVGGKGLFTKEIEIALEEGVIDAGVHSGKDVATRLPEGLELVAFLEREDIRDAFLSLTHGALADMPEGARLGTSSLRRAAQIRHRRPDLDIVGFRGNVQTRLQKLREGVADGTLLALAGLNRLDQRSQVTEILDPELFPPAPAQGAIGLEIRAEDTRTRGLVAPLDHAETTIAVRAERAFLRELDGSCRTPIAARSTLGNGQLTIFGQLLTPDGREIVEGEKTGPAGEADALGQALGAMLIARAGPDFIKRFAG
ncbi:hydroxymethylbilane synthase [Arsenicitalea aurantiaca]|uniref:Porphobilinogen deaminase n=1 Tax=Arsenicitalea aurantiaca TaxID=1783274 RepID=A0A433X5L0_9HYPH|nr:hydroxymethylbilane synthase [Arsenicitalea aurantiaca]RUT29349.1 hydroxymethylbilane synthase [Arsenicitalea aurantiaca]